MPGAVRHFRRRRFRGEARATRKTVRRSRTETGAARARSTAPTVRYSHAFRRSEERERPPARPSLAQHHPAVARTPPPGRHVIYLGCTLRLYLLFTAAARQQDNARSYDENRNLSLEIPIAHAAEFANDARRLHPSVRVPLSNDARLPRE